MEETATVRMHTGFNEVLIHNLQIREFTAQLIAEVVEVQDMRQAVFAETHIRYALISPHVIPTEEALGRAFRNALHGFDEFDGVDQGRLPIQ